MVLHGGGQSLGPAMGTPSEGGLYGNGVAGLAAEFLDLGKETPGSSDHDPEISPVGSLPQRAALTRDIAFADEVNHAPIATPMEDVRVPQQMSAEQQIAFLENQRNPKDKNALRIPGPREFDRGDVPRKLSRDNNEDSSERSPGSSVHNAGGDETTPTEEDRQDTSGRPIKRKITIDESNAVQTRQNKQTPPSSRLTFRNTASNRSENTPSFERQVSLGRPRSQSNTFSGLRSSNSKERDHMPYLSWQPTIGRNSAFVDLTEEQREELGGIEYRSLKTLAILLVSKFQTLRRCYSLL